MQNLTKYVEQLNGWNKLFGGEKITFPLTDSVKEELLDKLDCDLSPENLTCDGELAASKVKAKAKYLNAVLAELKAYQAPTPAPVAVPKASGYVVYEPNTTVSPFLKYGSIQVFATLAVAKAMRSRFFKANPEFTEDLAVAPVEEFYKIQKTKTVKNLMTGKELTIPVNTPPSCDPSTETYWSM